MNQTRAYNRDWVDIMFVYRTSGYDQYYTSKECNVPLHLLELYIRTYGEDWNGEMDCNWRNNAKFVGYDPEADMPPKGPWEPDRIFSTNEGIFDVMEFPGGDKIGWLI